MLEKLLKESVAYLQSKTTLRPKIAMVLGSGLSDFAKYLKEITRISYEEIPHFPHSTVDFHAGELICGKLGDLPVWLMNGRFHYYEGYEMQTTAYPIFVWHALGVETVILTNASGGIRPDYRVGDLVCVTDHIKLCAESPVRGVVPITGGERFFTMQDAYDPHLREIAHSCARAMEISLHDGVYAYMSGPQFETPAEIRALRILGGDLCGMSTVAEVIAARQCAMKVLCISCVTNLAAGCGTEKLSYEEVLETGQRIKETFGALMQRILQTIGKETEDENSI